MSVSGGGSGSERFGGEWQHGRLRLRLRIGEEPQSTQGRVAGVRWLQAGRHSLGAAQCWEQLVEESSSDRRGGAKAASTAMAPTVAGPSPGRRSPPPP